MDLAAFFQIKPTHDGMEVKLSLADCKPAPLKQGAVQSEVFAAIIAAVKARGIVAPVDPIELKVGVMPWLRSGIRAEVVIVKARAPIAGKDGTIALSPPKPPVAPPRRTIRADPRNLGFVLNVEAGAILGRATHATRGQPGENIFGAAIPAQDGKDVAITANEGVRVDVGAHETIYCAAAAGILLELSLRRIAVGSAIEIKHDIDHTTGNIEAWGALVVRGSIEAGFAVRARGDVTITGTCESAFIESGGDVIIQGGLLGRSGRTEVKCKGSLTAFFVENAKVEAGGDVIVKDSVVNSRVLAKGSIDVVGRAVACHLASGRSVAAATFGSDARLPVEIVVGGDPIGWQRLARLHRAHERTRRMSLKSAPVRGARASSRQARKEADRRATLRRAAGHAQGTIARQERALAATLTQGGGPSVTIRANAFPKTKMTLGPHGFEVHEPELASGTVNIDVARGEAVFVPSHSRNRGRRE